MTRRDPVRILFVCLGNICRSPAAEGVLRQLVTERGLDTEVEVASAGTGGYHVGEPADRRMRQAAAQRGIPLDSRARQVTAEDLEAYDLVIAMDRENLQALEQLAPAESDRVRLLGSFLEGDDSARDVPDPYFGGARGFEVVLDMLEEAAERILEEARALSERRA